MFPFSGQTMVPNLYAITGHGSKGWTLSFGSAELLADIIEGNQTKVKLNEILYKSTSGHHYVGMRSCFFL